ncbi:MAG: beta-propeller fold lactonase family protein, partial [Nitriliruptorales bacterium]|nr:beta-propeller fold lactonase family protein [Nitriliruptorales bacterium]
MARRRGAVRFAVLCVLALAALAAGTASTATGASAIDVVFVANAEDGTVSVIETDTLTVIRTYDVIPDGPEASFEEDPEQALIGQRAAEEAGGVNVAQDLDLSPDGMTLYVSRGHRGDVAAFDLNSGDMLWRTSIAGVRADHMTIAPDGSRLYVSALMSDVVEVLDTGTGAIVDSFPTGQFPHDNHLSPDGRRLYNASIGNVLLPWEVRDLLVTAGQSPYVVSVTDTETGERLASHQFAAGVRPFALAHDETRLWAQLSEWSGVIEYDLEAREISRRLDLPVDEGTSEEDYDFEAPHHGLAVTADESMLCLAGRISDYAAIVDVETFTAVALIATGDAPSWAANSPDDRHCFIANNRDDTVSVISYATLTEEARIPTGDGPKYIE